MPAAGLSDTLADAVPVFDHARMIPPDASASSRTRLRTAGSDELGPDEVGAIRALLDSAFDDPAEPDERFTDDDWQHALGGTHVILEVDGRIVAHASVVARELHVGGRPLRAGYVEAVATDPARQGEGFGTRVMEVIGTIIGESFEIGALGTGRHRFYERLGWRTWQGEAFVRTPDGDQRTPDDEGYILWLPTPATPAAISGSEPISCDWRPGDVW